jgi:RNase P/RNase MRP subunit p30
MKKAFADLHLRSNPKEPQTFKRHMQRAAKFGYRYISVPFVSEPQSEEAEKIKVISKDLGVDFVLRADLRPRNENELMTVLRRIRRKFEVICVICDNKEVARQAAKDRRVDLLNFPSLDYHKRFFDRPEAELACNSLAALEIDIKPLLTMEGPPRVRLLSSLRREVSIAQEFHVPLIVSSGVSEERFMRTPRDMASLSFLFGLDEASALETVSFNPETIIARNREKLGSHFVAPGISVIKEGNDC